MTVITYYPTTGTRRIYTMTQAEANRHITKISSYQDDMGEVPVKITVGD